MPTWTELLRVAGGTAIGTIGSFVVARGVNGILVLDSAQNYQIILDLPPYTNGIQIVLNATTYMFLVMASGDIVVLRQN